LDVSKAIHFIEENGTELEKYRLDFLLGKKRDEAIPLTCLKRLQNDDGGFPYSDEKDKLSGVNSTNVKLSLMIELGLTKSEVCRKTIEYLMKIQNEDGRWDENEAINQYNPPFWNIPGDLKTQMWLTASITNELIQLNYAESEAVRRATEFLLENRNEEGTFSGFLHSTWISVGVFGQLQRANSEVVTKALKVIERNISRMEDGAADFVWCLECFYIAGLPKNHPLVKRCIERVIKRQGEDGAWTSADGEKYGVSTTINALRVLKLYGLW